MKQPMGGLPHHVPIRRENRWQPIQHYALAPNTDVATVPVRRPATPDLLIPTRQDSFSTTSILSSLKSRNTEDGSDPRRSSKSLFPKSLLGASDEQHEHDISKTHNWFQHSDDSSASQTTDVTKPLSGSSLVTDGSSATGSKTNGDHYTVSEVSDFSDLSWPAVSAPNKDVITEESVKRVLRESAPHSKTVSSDQSITSTKLQHLREKMKRLREKNHQSRLQLQKIKSHSQSKGDRSLSSTEPTSESTDFSYEFPSQQATSSTAISVESESDSSTINSDPSCERPQTLRQPSKAYIHWMREREVQSISDESSAQTDSFARVPFHSIVKYSKFPVIAEEVEEPGCADDYDPASDPDIDINSSFDSSKQDSIFHQADESNLDEDLYINSSFDSSKCSSIADEVVRSLRAERRHMNSSNYSSNCASVAEEAVESLKAEVRGTRQYHPGIHIIRNYSMSKAKKAASKTSRSPLQQKLERRGRRPRSITPPPMTPKVQVQERRDYEMTPEAKNLAKELEETLAPRGPPTQLEETMFDSDGKLPLASEDSLSPAAKGTSPFESTPKSFRERRDAYLKRIGYSNEHGKSPFTTANLVLGNLPVLPSPATEPMKEPITRSIRRRSRNVNPRKNKSIAAQKQYESDGNSKNHGRHVRSRRKKPMRETGKSDTNPQNWAQNSFLNHQTRNQSEKEASQGWKQTRRVSKEKKKYDSAVETTSMASLTNLQDDKPQKKVQEESKAKERDVRCPSSYRRPAKRNSKQSALDHPGEKNASKLSQRLLGISSKSQIENDGKEANISPSSKSSIERRNERPSTRISENNSKSSIGRGRETSQSYTKPLRSPSMTRRKLAQIPRDSSCKTHDTMESTHHASNTRTSQNTSSWKVEEADHNHNKEETKCSRPSSGRFSSIKKPSSGRFGKSSNSEAKPARKRLSRKIAAIVSKFSSDRNQDKSRRASYQSLGNSFDEDGLEDLITHTQKARVDRRDDSYQSPFEDKNVKRPSSFREGAARSVDRNNSYTSNTVTTFVSDPSSSDNSSDSSSNSSGQSTP